MWLPHSGGGLQFLSDDGEEGEGIGGVEGGGLRLGAKALVLLSGGLDSILVLHLLRQQGIECIGVHFTSPFFRSPLVPRLAEEMGIPLYEIDITDEVLELLKSPPHGFGSQMNPCIDCHALMLRKARELMEEVGADFVATGEVLGERPFSQNLQSLRIVERESGLEGRLLRPLSAKLLPPTLPEQEGLVDREKLLDIKGRGRKRQLELAKSFGLKEIPTPAGGCLLTDPGFSKRLRDLLENGELSRENVELLKIGRHFRLAPGVKLVVGRNMKENERIRLSYREGDALLDSFSHKGPDALLRGKFSEEDIEVSARILARYADLEEGEDLTVKVKVGEGERFLTVSPLPWEAVDSLRI